MIKTKYGNASIDNEGYYRIHTKTEGNRNKLLHRLIFEEEHGKLSVNDIVHHKDGDRLNNDLSNLELISKEMIIVLCNHYFASPYTEMYLGNDH